MPKVTINEAKCKGCGLCIDVCPKKILAFSDRRNTMGYAVVECIDDEACILCQGCAMVCPDVVFTLKKPEG